MPQSLARVLVHIIFSTKNRVRFIRPEIEKEHHRKRSFQEEYRAILRQYKVEYDERYVWD